jgi:hypothetical protein
MYHPTSISSLSPSQISKALKGLPVRVSAGNHHDIELSADQIKKFAKAGLKGKASTITLDPFQIQNHMHLLGSSVGRRNKYNKWVDALGARDLINSGMSKGASTISGSGNMRDLNTLLTSREALRASHKYGPNMGKSHAFDDEDDMAYGFGVGRRNKYNKWVDALGARDLINAGMSKGASTISGVGVKKRGRPRKHGGALKAAGY